MFLRSISEIACPCNAFPRPTIAFTATSADWTNAISLSLASRMLPERFGGVSAFVDSPFVIFWLVEQRGGCFDEDERDQAHLRLQAVQGRERRYPGILSYLYYFISPLLLGFQSQISLLENPSGIANISIELIQTILSKVCFVQPLVRSSRQSFF